MFASEFPLPPRGRGLSCAKRLICGDPLPRLTRRRHAEDLLADQGLPPLRDNPDECDQVADRHGRLSSPGLSDDVGFELLAGEPVVGLHDPARRRHFCGWRISWIFARVAAREGFVTLRSAMFEGGEALRPYMETCASETLAFAQTGAAESFPEARDFGRFMAADRDWPG